MAKKTMVLNFKDDAYFYKFGEQSRINEVLYEIRETVNRNFRGIPFVTDISYYLKRNENSYDYVATITYEADETDETEPKPTLVLIEKNKKFTMNVRKMDYENYDELKSSVEKEMDRKIAKFFDEHRDYTITNKESEWVEEEDGNVLVVNVTYTAPYADEKVNDGQT